MSFKATKLKILRISGYYNQCLKEELHKNIMKGRSSTKMTKYMLKIATMLITHLY